MIIDASVAFKWMVEEELSSEAIGLIGTGELHAPALITAEVANALWKRLARGELTDAEGAGEQLEQLPDLLTLADDQELGRQALAIATMLNHPVYDCLYLALAQRLDQPLITADERFLRRVKTSEFAAMVRALA